MQTWASNCSIGCWSIQDGNWAEYLLTSHLPLRLNRVAVGAKGCTAGAARGSLGPVSPNSWPPAEHALNALSLACNLEIPWGCWRDDFKFPGTISEKRSCSQTVVVSKALVNICLRGADLVHHPINPWLGHYWTSKMLDWLHICKESDVLLVKVKDFLRFFSSFWNFTYVFCKNTAHWWQYCGQFVVKRRDKILHLNQILVHIFCTNWFWTHFYTGSSYGLGL